MFSHRSLAALAFVAASVCARSDAQSERPPFQDIKDAWGPDSRFEPLPNGQRYPVDSDDPPGTLAITRWRVAEDPETNPVKGKRFLVECFNSNCAFVFMPDHKSSIGPDTGETSFQRIGNSILIVSRPPEGVLDAKNYDKRAVPQLAIEIIGPDEGAAPLSGRCPIETVVKQEQGTRGDTVVEYVGKCKPLKADELVSPLEALKMAEGMEGLGDYIPLKSVTDPEKIATFAAAAQKYLADEKRLYAEAAGLLSREKIRVPAALLTASSFDDAHAP